ncbi:MAG: DUF5658 family protein [Salinarchaeum sp.]
MSPRPLARRQIDVYWRWFAISLFLLLPVDLLTTYGAAAQYGLAYEVNPLMRWLLPRGIITITVVHLGLVAVSAVGFWGILAAVERTRPPLRRPLVYGLEVWLVLLIVAGLIIVMNNLAVIVVGESLLAT